LLLALLSIGVAACASVGSDQLNEQVSITQQAEKTQELIVQANKEVKQETQLVRDELEATDPSSVMLASGRIQFVEFFAFW
jgi:two-component SAPR family response regulator